MMSRILGTITGLLILNWITAVQAQTNDRLQIRWEGNPQTENVEWYIVKHDNGSGTNEMPVMDQTSFLHAESGLYQSIIPISRFNVSDGDRICIRVQAARGVERSVDSDPACLVYTSTPTEPPPPQLSISQPTIVQIIIIRD